MKILLGYSYYRSPVDIRGWVDAWLARLRVAGIDVHGFPLTIDPPGPALTWPELERDWQRGDRKLLSMYEQLAKISEDYEIFVNWNGINLHPDFVAQLPTFNVYGCFDDPESSDLLSKPVAAAYDLAMVGNIAELESYRKWGVKQVRFWPLGFRVDDYDPFLTAEHILIGSRDVDIALLCEREMGWRRQRVDRFANAFPDGCYYGKGWPRGYLDEAERVPLLQRTKIGPNFHNSTGPVNFRTYILPANGVLQICDNRSHLSKLFDLNKEVIGFDTVEEAIDLCRYYLAHDEERRQIAAAGWVRAVRDYNEIAVFNLVEKYVHEIQPAKASSAWRASLYVRKHRRRTLGKQVMDLAKKHSSLLRNFARRVLKR